MIRFPENAPGVVDVTKAPYYCDNTGKNDCTAALKKAIDDFFAEYRDAFEATNKKLDAMPGEEAWIGFEIRRVNGEKCVIWPEKLPAGRILYFPRGTYLVSDTISYSFEHFRNIFRNVPYLEMNGRLRFVGEDRDTTVIRLRDNCPGFEYGNDRPVISFMRGEASNIAMTNMIENLTVNVGRGNHGATGVCHFANNTGAARHLRIVSEDGGGCAGFEIIHDKASACFARDIEVDGFDYGFRVTPQTHFAFFEHITARHQKRAGFFVGDTIVSIRDYVSENTCPALRTVGFDGHTVCVDSRFSSPAADDFAIRQEFGTMFLNNVTVDGYSHALSSYYLGTLDGPLDNVSTHGSVTGLDVSPAHTLCLPVEETPEPDWDDPRQWALADAFGAVGDGVTPCSDAVQRALDSGKSTVCFGAGTYLFDHPVRVPASVRRINFMYCDLADTEELKKQKTGLFIIGENDESPLILEDLFAFEQLSGFPVLLDHACTRTLVLSDLHTQAIAMYENSVPGGKVFLENVGCTVGGIPGTGGAGEETEKAREKEFSYSRLTPCYRFTGQQVWARQMNPERSKREVVNDGGTLWVLGYKAEEEGTAFETVNGGQTEVLGGTLCICYADRFPALINKNSRVSFISSSITYAKGKMWSRIVEETRGDETLTLTRDRFPARVMDMVTVPLYHGDLRATKER